MRHQSRLSPPEILKAWTSLEPDERAEAEARMRAGKTLRKFPGGGRAQAGAVRDKIGRIAGVSGRTVEKCIAVYAAAADEPELLGPVVEYLERTENFHDAFNRMRRTRDLARVRHLAPIEGRFSTLVLDPAWNDESVSEQQRPPYATLSVEDIRAVPVPGWQLPQGHIYVHAPGPFVPIAVELIRGWGYDFKTLLTWQKPRWSMGRYFRTEDEFVVFGTRGGLMTARQDLSNHFRGPVGEHSAKPDSFYDLVRAASQPPFGEGFQRLARPGFVNLYVPVRETAVQAAAVMVAAE